jgi:hypothetical protein
MKNTSYSSISETSSLEYNITTYINKQNVKLAIPLLACNDNSVYAKEIILKYQ